MNRWNPKTLCQQAEGLLLAVLLQLGKPDQEHEYADKKRGEQGAVQQRLVFAGQIHIVKKYIPEEEVTHRRTEKNEHKR